MRERVLDALYKKIEKNPDDFNLQRQIVLLNKSHISTIHAFCLEVIKNNFYKTEISPSFRLANTPEIELLRMEVLEDLFEKLYTEKNEAFVKLVETYCGYKDDDKLKEIILKIYKYIQSMPYPEEWLEKQVEKFNINIEQDFAKTVWGEILVNEAKDTIQSSINTLKATARKLEVEADLSKWYIIIKDDISNLENLVRLKSWDSMYMAMKELKLKTWAQDRKIVSDVKDNAKQTRDKVKEKIDELRKKVFLYSSEQANKDIFVMYDILKKIADIVLKFSEEYKKAKKQKNIIDFNDIEHLALQILVQKDEKGNYVPTDVAKEYKNLFEEIAIDEYQDSNEIQEEILKQVSRGNNIFMVGDVKQSIYKFRQAKPELFLEKYNTYNENKIGLFANFRSRKNVLDLSNVIFENIMSKEFGSIEYNESEFLNLGQEYAETEEKTLGKAEIHIIDEAQEVEVDEQDEILENTEIEAKLVAKRLQELMKENCYVFDKRQGYRKLQYKDIVILLRKTTKIASIYEKELSKLGYPVFSDIGTNYFESIEIQTIMSLLKIISNPDNDIALVTVLRSPIFNFTDNELIEIRTENKEGSFYKALISNKKMKSKIDKFLNMIEDFKNKQEYLKLNELIWYIYEKTGYYNYVKLNTNGEMKSENLKMLFEKAKDYEQGSFKGLHNFINFIDKVTKSSMDMGAPKLIGENENVIRIMSIHKSKGLEFPVVFLCGTGNNFNMLDLNDNILIHSELGFGPKYINHERKIEYNTLAKETIKYQVRKELKEEEMRLLYVALTRAREKLIITGIDKNLQKSWKSNEEDLQANSNKITKIVAMKAKSYLDWIEQVIIADERIKNLLEIYEHKKDEGIIEEAREQETQIELEDRKINEQIDKILTWKYYRDELTRIEGKSSISRLTKEMEKEEPVELKKPKFMQDIIELTKAEIGTAVHLVMQKLEFKQIYTKQKIEEMLDLLEEKEIITQKQKEKIPVNKILEFSQSKIFKEAAKAKEIYKEKPFYMNIPVKNIYESTSDENILIQGIIDLYYIDERGDITLVDYKTDYVPENNQEYLIKKYEKQLKMYKQAIEQALGKKVDKTYIYSTYLGKEIEMPN